MWDLRFFVYPAVKAGILVIMVAVIGIYLSAPSYASALKQCENITEDSEQIECIFKIIEEALDERGIAVGFDVFSSAYNDFESFASSGCHRHAHRVGDIAYYLLYIPTEDLSSIDFPQETTSCGYGFFHGFLEHLVQDHPDPEFVMEACEELASRLESTMGDIRTICYHGSGHGFQLAHAEGMPRNAWGDVSTFASAPLKDCAALTRASEKDQEECQQGIFNVLVDWMVDEEYGFSYDFKRPFRICNEFYDTTKGSCYYEMAQKLDSVSELDPLKMYEVVRTGDAELSNMAFGVGIAGIMQQVITSPRGYAPTLEKCAKLPADYYERCVRSTVNGLFEHGAPQEEYKKPLTFCEDPVLVLDSSDVCYDAIAERLPRFYPTDKIRHICKEFPDKAQHVCFAQL